jgi:hypothetical protein
MHYEFEIRKRTFELVRLGGITAHAAMLLSIADRDLRSIHFITPFNFSILRSTRSSNGNGGGGGGSGNNEGNSNKNKKVKKVILKKNAGGKGKIHVKTADGKDICFKYNRGQKCDSSCGRVHICQLCFGSHTMKDADCLKRD